MTELEAAAAPHSPGIRPRSFLDDLIGSLWRPFAHSSVVVRALIALIVSLVPLVGWLFLSGYSLRFVRECLGRGTSLLPRWRHFGDLALDGLRQLVVTIAFSALGCLGGLVGLVVLLAASLVTGTSFLEWGRLVAAGVILAPALLVMLALVPLATMRLAAEGLAGAFDFVAHWRCLVGHPRIVGSLLLFTGIVTGTPFVLALLSGTGGFPGEYSLPGGQPEFPTPSEFLLPSGSGLLLQPLTIWGMLAVSSATGLAGRWMGIRLAPGARAE